MNKNKIDFSYGYAYTHGGIFHADDAFATAFLKMIDPYIVIMRGMEQVKLYGISEPKDGNENVIVFDIGFGKYDHHGDNKELRPNGIPYAAFGKLWREFAPKLFGEYVTKKLDSTLVQEIDAYDNGVKGSESNISRFIHNLNPTWEETSKLTEADVANDKYFFRAVYFADNILCREIEVAQSAEYAVDYINILLDKREIPEILVMPEYAPWMGVAFKHPELLFCIFPSTRDKGCWNMQVVPKSPNTREARLDVPSYWKGYNAKYGKEAPVNGMTFCHPSGFLSTFLTLEDAENAAKKAIEFSKLEMPKPDVQGLPNS